MAYMTSPGERPLIFNSDHVLCYITLAPKYCCFSYSQLFIRILIGKNAVLTSIRTWLLQHLGSSFR